MVETIGNKKWKDIENSDVSVFRTVKVWKDVEGNMHKRIMQEHIAKPLDLGSINKPKNEDIDTIQITVPEQQKQRRWQNNPQDFWREFFGF